MILTYIDNAQPMYPFTFTYLSYNGIFLYLISALYISLMKRNEKYEDKVPQVVGWINSVLYQCSYCYHLIVPIVYWALLATDFATYRPFTQAVSVLVHGFDFFIMTIEFILNRQQPTFFTVALYVVISVLYMFWTWIYYSISNIWVVFVNINIVLFLKLVQIRILDLLRRTILCVYLIRGFQHLHP